MGLGRRRGGFLMAAARRRIVVNVLNYAKAPVRSATVSYFCPIAETTQTLPANQCLLALEQDVCGGRKGGG